MALWVPRQSFEDFSGGVFFLKRDCRGTPEDHESIRNRIMCLTNDDAKIDKQQITRFLDDVRWAKNRAEQEIRDR